MKQMTALQNTVSTYVQQRLAQEHIRVVPMNISAHLDSLAARQLTRHRICPAITKY